MGWQLLRLPTDVAVSPAFRDATSFRGNILPHISDRTGYDYHHHAEVGSSNASFVGDEVTDRFCVLGEVDEHVEKLRELAAAGVDQFNLYLMNGDEEAMLRIYGREIIPELKGVAAASIA